MFRNCPVDCSIIVQLKEYLQLVIELIIFIMSADGIKYLDGESSILRKGTTHVSFSHNYYS